MRLTAVRINKSGQGLALLAGLLLAGAAHAQSGAPRNPATVLLEAPSDEQSYRKEIVFGANFNTQGGLLGGVMLRSSRALDGGRWLRFWSLEGVSFKNPKEERVTNVSAGPLAGGSYVLHKTNYALALRPSFGVQRVLFRKAPDAGVQVNALLSGGPSLGLLMPYYISYDYTAAVTGRFNSTDDIRDEQFDPEKHSSEQFIIDRAPLFAGIGGTSIVPGAHLRGALSFEYGRYRDAVAGLEAGFLLEAYARHLKTLVPPRGSTTDDLNRQFFPSVYITLYIGYRS